MITSMKDTVTNSEITIVNMMHVHRKYFTPQLEVFVKHYCPSLLIWELLLFQGVCLRNEDCEGPLTKVPVWLRKVCNKMLTEKILTSHGISDLVQVVLDKSFDEDMEDGNIDGSKMQAVARLVSYNPVRHISVGQYIQGLSTQVFRLLHLRGTPMDNLLKYIASCIILQFCERDIKSAEETFLVKLLRPLWLCVRQSDPQGKCVVKESDLSACIADLHQIFVSSASPLSRRFMHIIYPFSHCLLSMFFFLLSGQSFLKSKVKNLITVILRNSSDDKALSLLHAVSFTNNKSCGVYLTNVCFKNGDDGGIIAVPHTADNPADDIVRYHTILELLSELQNKNLNRAFILLVLKEFCNFHLQSKNNASDPENVKSGLLFNALLQELSEWNVDIGEALMSNISEVIDILMTLLDSICNCRSDSTFYEKTLWVVLMILNSILESDEQLRLADWTTLKKCLPNLQKLQQSDVDVDLKEIIFSIIVHIATHGTACKNGGDVMKEFMEKYPEHRNMKINEQSFLEIVERFEKVTFESKSKTPARAFSRSGSTATKRTAESSEKSAPRHALKKSADAARAARCEASSSKQKVSTYEMMMKEIKNPGIPVKGHGIVTLARLLQSKDAETLQNKKEIMEILQECIEHEDSYVYLIAIQAMALLGELDTELVLPTVLSMYENDDVKHEVKLKLGEVLLRMSNSMGDMIYKYKEDLLHTYLVGTKHKDSQIRSSSLSNLGQTCMCLKFNINGPWLQEILICALAVLKTDKDLEVRRCAMMVIYLIIKGAGKDMLTLLENDIKTIYSQLKTVFSNETDDVLRLHCQLALEEINMIMKELFWPKVPLTKEIRILQ